LAVLDAGLGAFVMLGRGDRRRGFFNTSVDGLGCGG
jgi:hypothetical protein